MLHGLFLALQGRVSQSKQEAIRAEIRTQLGTPEGKLSPIQSSYCIEQGWGRYAAAHLWTILFGAGAISLPQPE